MRTSNQYSDEQRRVWKERDVSDTIKLQEEKMSYEKKREHATISAEEISRTVYNRMKSAKGVKLLLDKPNMFIVEDDVWHYVVYIAIGDKCYRSYGHHIGSWENFDQTWAKTRVVTHIHFLRKDSPLL
jgi:hypothetical protein